MKQLLARIIVALVLSCASCASASAQNRPEVPPDEYKVYEAVLDLMSEMPKPDVRVTISNTTLNSKCGEEASPIPTVNGCGFLWIQPDDANSLRNLLFENGAPMDNATWADFVKKNAESSVLHEPIKTPWKHKLIGPGNEPDKDWQSPDLGIFLSRVGFNATKSEAVVYVLAFSYMKDVSTEGDYFVFSLDKTGKWQPQGRVAYFTTEQKQDQQH